ncbi:MAG: hypothetical protein HZY73_11535 [Micropruina sp.]|nr:MAG: hypothetical protein HZY73_11535 [Micropruina sp.]
MPAVVDRIQVRDPDVVCLQENEGMPASGVKQVTGLAEQLPGYATLPTSVAEDTLQILFRKEYLEFLEGASSRSTSRASTAHPRTAGASGAASCTEPASGRCGSSRRT